MTNFAKIDITFSDDSDLDSTFKVNFTNISRSINIDQTWICKGGRSSAYEYQKGIDSTTQANAAGTAASADIANSSLSAYINVIEASLDSSEFSFEANEYGWTIDSFVIVGNTNATDVVIPEVLPPKDFQLTGYSKAEAVAPCADVQVTLTQNGDGVAPFTWVSPSNASTTLVADLARATLGQFIAVTIQDDEGDQATLSNVFIPPLFNSTFITDISVVANSGGLDSTVTIFMDNPLSTFDYTYSIDGINFFVSNIFNGVLDGSYTLTVNDGFGCLTTQGFTVDASQSIQRANAFAEVSPYNTFRHVQEVSKQYQTLENTLYRDQFYLGDFKPDFAQPFQTNDPIIVTQYQTNYDERTTRLWKYCKGGTDTIDSTLSSVLKSNNIGSVDKRDCIIYNAGDNQTGIYFTSGNIYDPDTDTDIGDYTLNGNLPEWGVAGNTVVLTSLGSFIIKQTKFDSTVQAQVLIIDSIWTGGSQSTPDIAQCTYDRLPYEDYEFDVDLSSLDLGLYYTQVILTDSLEEYPDLIWTSELFEVVTVADQTNFIEYYDSDESGINYDTGYKTYLRIESVDPYKNLTPGGTSTPYNNSNGNTVLLKNNSSMIGSMFFQNCPQYMIEKINVLFGNKNILINGLEWVKEDDLETINFDKSALKNATITLKRKNYNANKNDNILIDGPNGRILQETGSILY